MLWLLKRIANRLRPRPGSLTLERTFPLRESRVRQIIENLPAGTSALPGALVSVRDAGVDRSEVSVTTRVPFGRSLLGLAAPWIVPALERKTTALLFPSLRRSNALFGTFEYVLFIAFKAREHFSGPPFAAGTGRYVLQAYLTQRPIPFEENAVHFEILEETELRTRTSRTAGFISLPVTRHTVFRKGSGGVIERHGDRIDLGLCDERRGLAAKCSLRLERPFGRGNILPAEAGRSRVLFRPDNPHVEILEQTLHRPANEIWFLELLDGTSSLESFVSGLLGVRATLNGAPVFLPRLKIENSGSKIVSVTDLIF